MSRFALPRSGLVAAVSAQIMRAPRIWDDAALADWATPVAGLNVRPAHYSSAEDHAVPADNLKTYPFYPPDREPAGYWAWAEQTETGTSGRCARAAIRTRADWITAGERAFHEMDALLASDPSHPRVDRACARPGVIARTLRRFPTAAFNPLRWVVTPQGVMLSAPACSACHPPERTRSQRGGDRMEIRAAKPREGAGARRQPLHRPGATGRPSAAVLRRRSAAWVPVLEGVHGSMGTG